MKGILFRPEMHLAIRQGKKTVTRRLVTPQPTNNMPTAVARFHFGEIIYIKEAWRIEKEYPLRDEHNELVGYGSPDISYKLDKPNGNGKWETPLFMPQWAARDFIIIRKVIPLRLQEITSEDVIKEGLPDSGEFNIENYKTLWNSINDKLTWDKNPWVWRYEFMRIDKPHRTIENA